MDAVAALGRIMDLQRAFQILGTFMLTAYMFPKQAVVTEMEEFDFIVVGAGSAGAVVAARLAEAQARVLLVEAGGDPPLESKTPGLIGLLPRTQYDWNYTNDNCNTCFTCHRNKTVNLTCGRMLGGGSSINYMMYVRGCPEDFTPWAIAAQDSTWDWENVLPYFIKSENLQDEEILNSSINKYHGTSGFLGVSRQPSSVSYEVLESFRELDHDMLLDINADVHLGYNYRPMFTITEGVRQSTALTILAAHKNNPYLHVLKDTLVTKILFDENNNAIGIKAIIMKNKQIEIRAKKEVIVSAGALNTPHILMLSGIGPQPHLQSFNITVRSNLPVGMNLQDHVTVITSTKLEKSTEPTPTSNPYRFPLDMFAGYVALNKSKPCPDYQTINSVIPNDSQSILDLCVFNFGYDYYICQKIYEAGKGRRTLFTFLTLLHPKSRGRILLQNTNPIDPPIISISYLSDDLDLETLVDSLIDFVKILKTQYFKSVGAVMVDLELEMCKPFQILSREWWRCYVKCMVSPFHHYVGTCALGSVVDSHLRVIGVGNLRVVDASVMPTQVSANTNAATIMIAEKGAEFIKEDHVDTFNYPKL